MKSRKQATAGLPSAEVPIVFVVDDDASVLDAIRRLLRISGFEVRAFDQPSELLAEALPTSNACLLLDVHLPQMTGVELGTRLRSAGCTLPIVLITGHTDQATSRMTSKADVFTTLLKPFSAESLVTTIDRALHTPSANP